MELAKEESPQSLIEAQMQEIISLGNFEMAHLFSEEGLPLAEAKITEPINKDSLVEISVLFQEVKKMADVMGGLSQLKEILMEGNNNRKIVFRFFDAFDQLVVLALVIPPKKTYRSHANRLVRIIQKVSA